MFHCKHATCRTVSRDLVLLHMSACLHALTHVCMAPVWLSSENIRTVHPTKKLNYKWLGPYVVELLHPFEGDSIAEHQERHPLPPPPIVRDGIKEYEVEKILNSQILHRNIEYLVCWKGYDVEEDE